MDLIKGRPVVFGGVVFMGFPFTSASLLAQSLWSRGGTATWKQRIFCPLSLNKSISGNDLELALGRAVLSSFLNFFPWIS